MRRGDEQKVRPVSVLSGELLLLGSNVVVAGPTLILDRLVLLAASSDGGGGGAISGVAFVFVVVFEVVAHDVQRRVDDVEKVLSLQLDGGSEGDRGEGIQFRGVAFRWSNRRRRRRKLIGELENTTEERVQ